jgi:hypothetical protein|tara:strand:- start:11330 stop:12616 length:1287 start_codon:yes stop_codon:yes gene_type:complete
MAAVYPFSEFNGRMFYACMGVLVNKTGGRWGRLTQTGDANPTDSTFLTGVQSVGVSSDNPSSSLMDVGRFQKKYHYYSQQQFEVTIERVITETDNFFYHANASSYIASDVGYKDCHILKDDNIGCQGSTNPNSKSIRNFDITILYGEDTNNRLDDNTKVFQATYRNCLATSISYSMAIGGSITETIAFTTRGATYNENITASEYTLPTSAQSGNVLKSRDLDLLNTGPDWGTRYSVLPEEVTRMFKAQNDAGDTQSEGTPGTLQDILGLSSISVDVSIDYSEVADIGKWRGSIDQGLQNLWRHVVLPVQVSASFTGVLRQPFPRRSSPTSYLPNTDTTFSEADGSTSSKDWQYVNREIKLVAKKFTATPNFFVWDLGKKNYITGFSYSGGDTQGGNLEGTISYQNDTSDIVLVRDTVVRDLPAPTNPY